jgi:hypothetical protein
MLKANLPQAVTQERTGPLRDFLQSNYLGPATLNGLKLLRYLLDASGDVPGEQPISQCLK